MPYIIGFHKYNRLDQKEEAILYFKKAIEYNSKVKKFDDIQQILKAWEIKD